METSEEGRAEWNTEWDELMGDPVTQGTRKMDVAARSRRKAEPNESHVLFYSQESAFAGWTQFCAEKQHLHFRCHYFANLYTMSRVWYMHNGVKQVEKNIEIYISKYLSQPYEKSIPFFFFVRIPYIFVVFSFCFAYNQVLV